jgi:hypothetical protein
LRGLKLVFFDIFLPPFVHFWYFLLSLVIARTVQFVVVSTAITEHCLEAVDIFAIGHIPPGLGWIESLERDNCKLNVFSIVFQDIPWLGSTLDATTATLVPAPELPSSAFLPHFVPSQKDSLDMRIQSTNN